MSGLPEKLPDAAHRGAVWRRSWRPLLAAVSLLVLAAALAQPGPRALAREEVLEMLPVTAPSSQMGRVTTGYGSPRQAAALMAFANRHPNDPDIAVGAVLAGWPHGRAGVVQQLQQVEARFPGSGLAAAAVIHEIIRGVNWDNILYRAQNPGRPDAVPLSARTRRRIEQLQEASAHGEQIEPDNAYFALVSVMARFVLHQNRRALHEFAVAGNCTGFHAYAREAGADRQQVFAAAFRIHLGVARALLQTRNPRRAFEPVRQAAVAVSTVAVRLEQTGHERQAAQLLLGLFRISRVMLNDAGPAQEASGFGLFDWGIAPPARFLPARPPGFQSEWPTWAASVAGMETWLRALGQPAQATWVAQTASASRQHQRSEMARWDRSALTNDWAGSIGLLALSKDLILAVLMIAVLLIMSTALRTGLHSHEALHGPRWLRNLYCIAAAAAPYVISACAYPGAVGQGGAVIMVFGALLAVVVILISLITEIRAAAIGVVLLAGALPLGLLFLFVAHQQASWPWPPNLGWNGFGTELLIAVPILGAIPAVALGFALFLPWIPASMVEYRQHLRRLRPWVELLPAAVPAAAFAACTVCVMLFAAAAVLGVGSNLRLVHDVNTAQNTAVVLAPASPGRRMALRALPRPAGAPV